MAAKKIKFQTPFGATRYPHISKPDTTGKYADNKFKTKLVMKASDPEAQKFIKFIEDAAKEIHGSKGAKMHRPYVVDEDANEVIFTFKTSYAPAVFDGRGKQLPPIKKRDAETGELKAVGCKVPVGGGSIVRLSGQFVEFDKGITAQFNQVQVKELRDGAASSFDAIDDGFTYDASAYDDDEGDTDPASSFDSSEDEGSDGEDNPFRI